jgi:TetR/AcrR family transcriptional regulator, transcriptional repressor for nem operon
MGRSSKEQAEANRRRIVATAGNLFRSNGYDAVGIADVMKAAGMTQGGFYKHFASKEALAAEAWGQGFRGAGAIWRRLDKQDSLAVAIVDYYLSPKPPELRCPMVAHGEDVSRMNEDCSLRAVYADGAKGLHDTFMAAAKGSSAEAQAEIVFAAMIGANLLSRAAGDTGWIANLKKSIKSAVSQTPPGKKRSASRRSA